MNGFNQFGYGFNAMNPFVPPPSQQSSLQQYQNYMQQPMPQQENPYSLAGKFVKSFKDVQSEPIPSDGSQVLFMLEDEPVFYIASYNGAGKKVISGYKFEEIEMVKEEKQVEPMDILASLGASIDVIMDRLNLLENAITEPNKKEE